MPARLASTSTIAMPTIRTRGFSYARGSSASRWCLAQLARCALRCTDVQRQRRRIPSRCLQRPATGSIQVPKRPAKRQRSPTMSSSVTPFDFSHSDRHPPRKEAHRSSSSALLQTSAAVDSYEAGMLGTRHLVELGHNRVLHVPGPEGRNETIERQRCYEDAMAEAGLATRMTAFGTVWGPDSGHRAGLAVDLDFFSAVFAACDGIAFGFMGAIRRRGKEAPLDYSIVGVEDMPEYAYFAPPLTTMRMDFDQLGTVASDMIRLRIETGEREDLKVLPSSLMLRDSTLTRYSIPSRLARRLYGHQHVCRRHRDRNHALSSLLEITSRAIDTSFTADAAANSISGDRPSARSCRGGAFWRDSRRARRRGKPSSSLL